MYRHYKKMQSYFCLYNKLKSVYMYSKKKSLITKLKFIKN